MSRKQSRSFLVFIVDMFASLVGMLANSAAAAVPGILAPELGTYLSTHALPILAFTAPAAVFAAKFLDLLEEKPSTRGRRWLGYALTVLSIVSSAASGFIANFAAAVVPGPTQPYIVPILGGALVAGILYAVVRYKLTHPDPSPITEAERSEFAEELRNRYERRAGASLGEEALRGLDMDDAKRKAIRALIQPPFGRFEQEWPRGTPITQIYNDVRKRLLLWGESGAGKTTMLLDLALYLLGLVDDDQQGRIPVILSLASWSTKWGSLDDWIRHELTETYRESPERAAAWVKEDQILVLPLLDGLEEVPDKDFAACARAIDRFIEKHPDVPLVVCCSSTKDIVLRTDLNLPMVEVRPLKEDQIAAYLAPPSQEQIEEGARQGKQPAELDRLADLRQAAENDPNLRLAMATPLILSAMALIYQGKNSEQRIPSPEGDKEEWQNQFWDAFVTEMYNRKRRANELGRRLQVAENPPYTVAETRDYLGCVAAGMTAAARDPNDTQPTERDPEKFYVEQMQWGLLSEEDGREHPPIYLVGKVRWSWRGLIPWLAAASAVWLVVATVVGLFAGSLGGLNQGLLYGPLLGLAIGVIVGLLGLAFGQLGGPAGLFYQTLDPRKEQTPGAGALRSRKNGRIGGRVVGGAYVLGVWMASGLGIVLVGGLATVIFGELPSDVVVLGGAFGLFIALAIGVPSGYLAWDGLGGGAYREHCKLHRALADKCYAPKPGDLDSFLKFLKFADDLALFRQEGSGYRFIHSQLRDYLATKWKKKQEEERKKNQAVAALTDAALGLPGAASRDFVHIPDDE